jgi:hypothetical protein
VAVRLSGEPTLHCASGHAQIPARFCDVLLIFQYQFDGSLLEFLAVSISVAFSHDEHPRSAFILHHSRLSIKSGIAQDAFPAVVFLTPTISQQRHL